jgi:hypothetical protein
VHPKLDILKGVLCSPPLSIAYDPSLRCFSSVQKSAEHYPNELRMRCPA